MLVETLRSKFLLPRGEAVVRDFEGLVGDFARETRIPD